MEDFASLFGTKDPNRDLVDKFSVLLEKQTDQRLGPGALFGLMSLYNMMGIISIAKQDIHTGLKQVQASGMPQGGTGAQSGTGTQGEPSAGSLLETISALTAPAAAPGQPDLAGMLANLAGNKKMNPNLLLSLLSLMNSQMSKAPAAKGNDPIQPADQESGTGPGTLPSADGQGSRGSKAGTTGLDTAEKKNPDRRAFGEVRFGKRG